MNLVSSKQLIGELFSDFALEGTDWVPKVYRYISKGVAIMRLNGYYQDTFSKRYLQDYAVGKPCDLKELLGLLVIENNAVCALPIKNSPYIGKAFAGYLNWATNLAAVEGDHIRTTFEKGYVGFVYKAIPLDSEGYPLVPDNDLVFEALPFYIINRLGYGGFEHPVITREEAEAKWDKYYPRARNDVNFPTIYEVQNYHKMTTNPYYERFSTTDFYESVNEGVEVFLSKSISNNILTIDNA